MKKYSIKGSEITEILNLFFRIFKIHISFFDLQEYELKDFKPFKRTDFCRINRENKEFDKKCNECDKKNLQTAKRIGNIHIYKCHQGIFEGIVPLYDENRNYLGSLFFGQIREKGAKIPESLSKENKILYSKLPEYEFEHLKDISLLLKVMSQYVVRNEIIKYHNKPWCEKLEKYIEKNINRKITILDLAQLINKSTTFVTHRFQGEFGKSPKQYILEKKMQIAKQLLENGESVYNVADKMGFYDEFHFSKTFKKFWGSSPIKFKLHK